MSTAGQGRSGLGLEAQQAAVDRYLAERPGEILETVTEVESGNIVRQIGPVRVRHRALAVTDGRVIDLRPARRDRSGARP